jgi:hypothetical protein
MRLDALGGPTGVVGTVQSGIWRETPDGVTDVGSNPAAFDPPAPSLPPGPDIPELIVPDLPATGDVTTPPATALVIDCQMAIVGWAPPEGESIDIAPPDGLGHSGLFVPWRGVSGWFLYGGDETVASAPDMTFLDRMVLYDDSGVLTYNRTMAPEVMTTANDYAFGKNELVSLTGCFTFHYPDSVFQVRLRGDSGATGLTVEFHSAPDGFSTEPVILSDAMHLGGHYGIVVSSENAVAGRPGLPGNKVLGENGGLAGAPFPLDQEIRFGIWFDPSSEYQQIDVSSDGASTSFRDNDTLGTSELHYSDCPHASHHLTLTATINSGTAEYIATPPDIDHPAFTLCGLSLGYDSCVLNPNHEPGESTPGEPIGGE